MITHGSDDLFLAEIPMFYPYVCYQHTFFLTGGA
jgi:hypothetical protein